MDTVLFCYENVSNEYINEIIDILKYHNFNLAPQYIIEDETIARGYIRISDTSLFTAKLSAAMMLDGITRYEYPHIRYITNKIIFTNNYKWKPYFTRCDDNLNVVKSCDKCPYCVDDVSVSRFICNKANREIGYTSRQEFPEWCPLTDGWRTYTEFKKVWCDYIDE